LEPSDRLPANIDERRFLAFETDLILYRTIRVNIDDVGWAEWRMSMNDRYATVQIGKKQIEPEKLNRTRFWRARAHSAARNTPLVPWARVCVFYRFPTNHRREVANLQPTSKAIIDGLVDAGVVPDDNDNHIVGPDNRREPVNGPHKVIVRIFVRHDVT
jgi:hypothetical protein